jgi:glycerol uptake facilitator-like aquaporin
LVHGINMAVTIARSLSNTFTPAGVLAFIAAQLAGMLVAVAVAVWLWPNKVAWKNQKARTCSGPPLSSADFSAEQAGRIDDACGRQ